MTCVRGREDEDVVGAGAEVDTEGAFFDAEPPDTRDFLEAGSDAETADDVTVEGAAFDLLARCSLRFCRFLAFTLGGMSVLLQLLVLSLHTSLSIVLLSCP
jgi:hypothetical protein